MHTNDRLTLCPSPSTFWRIWYARAAVPALAG